MAKVKQRKKRRNPTLLKAMRELFKSERRRLQAIFRQM